MRHKNDDVEALNLLNKINTGVPYYNTVLELKIDIYKASLNYNEAMRLTGELRALGHENVRKANLLDALIMRNNKQPDAALALVEENIRETPYTDYMSLLCKGLLLYESERYTEAVPVLEKFVMECFSYYEGHWLLAECYLKQGRLSEALLAYATGALLAGTNNMDDFNSRLNQLGEVDAEVLNYFSAASPGNRFAGSDKLIASKVALSKQLKLDIELPLSWLKQLKIVLEENSVSDDNDVSHQLYLNFLQPHLVPDLQLYPFAVYYNKNKKVTEFIDQNRKYKKTVTKLQQQLTKEMLLISGTRILNAEERSKTDRLHHWVGYYKSVGPGSFREFYWKQPVKITEDLDKIKEESEQVEYEDGFLQSRSWTHNDSSVQYYLGREQQVARQIRSVDSHKYIAVFNRAGFKTSEEKFEKGKFNLLYYYPFGQLLCKKEVEREWYKVTLYYPDGNVKMIHYSSEDSWWKHDVDTVTIQYDLSGSVTKRLIIDRKNRVQVLQRYDADRYYEEKRYRNGEVIMRTYRNGQLLQEQREDSKGTLEQQTFYGNGQLKRRFVQYKDIFTERDMTCYRPDGTVYGKVNYHAGKLNSGYMLSPRQDTLWRAFREGDQGVLRAYDEMGLPDYTIQLGFDGSLFPEMYYYYANGAVKEYLDRSGADKKVFFRETEERFVSGKSKSARELEDTSGNIRVSLYFPNGNLSQETKSVKGNTAMQDTRSYHKDGLLRSQAQTDARYGYYGDVYLYGSDGRSLQVNTMDNECLVDHKMFVQDTLFYRKTLTGTDTLKIFSPKGEEAGYKLYKNGLPYGTGILFYKNGQLSEKKYYNVFGKIDSLVSFYPNGVLRRTIKYDLHGKVVSGTGIEMTGLVSNYFYSTGSGSRKAYMPGDGLQFITGEADLLLDDITVLQDKDTLFYTRLHNQGMVRVRYRTAGGKLESRTIAPEDTLITVYHTNSKKALSLPLDKYVISGDMVLYYKSGTPAVKSQWKYNMLHGEHGWYNAAGKLIEQQFYEYGRASKSYKFWDDSGKLLIEGINYGAPNEIWKYWDAKSRQMVEEDLVN